ncbi:condensin complex non-SMC subunit Cnd1, partial [Cryomyces antarcticus]
MESHVDFDLNESLKHYQDDPSAIATPEADSALVDCENDPEALTSAVINSVLNPIVDSVAENPDAIVRSSNFDTLQFLLKSPSLLPPNALSKILDLVVSGLAAEADVVHNDLEADEQESVQHHKQPLEMFAFLLQWTMAAVETKAAEKPASAPAARGKGAKSAKSKTGANKDGSWDSSMQ